MTKKIPDNAIVAGNPDRILRMIINEPLSQIHHSEEFPVSEILSLPMYAELSQEKIARVAEAIQEYIALHV